MRYLIEGPLESDYSLAIVNRLLAYALIERGLDVTLHERDNTADYVTSPDFAVEHPELAKRLRNPIGNEWFEAHSRYIFPPHTDRMYGEFNGAHCYGWEESVFPARYAEWMNEGLDFVTTMSDYTLQVLKRAGVSIPLFNVGLGADHILSSPAAEYRGLERANTFDFLHVSSCFPRKGVDVLIQAFAGAFTRKNNVRLIIKTAPNPHNRVRELIQDADEKYPSHAPIVVINSLVNASQMRWLYENTHCLVAPSRGEGFGLPAAEAMLLRKPVIATAHSGHAEFCDEGSCWPVQYTMSRAASHLSEGGSLWAEPSEESLQAMMHTVRNAKPDHLKRKIDTAERRIREQFTWARVAERQLNAVQEVRARAKNSRFFLPRPGSAHVLPPEGTDTRVPIAGPAEIVSSGAKPAVAVMTSWNCRCGIAEYSRYIVSSFEQLGLAYVIFASTTDAPVRLDEPWVRRCWTQGDLPPGQFRRLVDEIVASGVRVLSIQYNWGLFRPAVLDYLIRRVRENGIRVEVTLHAVRATDFAGAREALTCADLIVVHRERDRDFLESQGFREVALLPHGNPVPRTPPERRHDDWFTVSSFGFLLPAKGIYELLVAFACALKINPRMRLELSTALYPLDFSSMYANACRRFIQQNHLGSRVTLDTRFADGEAVLDRLGESDLVILPYTYSTESASGAIRLPLASMRPVLCSDLQVFQDAADLVHMYPAGNTVALARRILEFSRRPAELLSKQSAQRAFTERLAWPRISSMFADLCLGMVETDKSPVSAVDANAALRS